MAIFDFCMGRRTLARACCYLGISALALSAASALAAGTELVPVRTSTALVTVPGTSQSNQRFQNFAGTAFERKMIRRGAAGGLVVGTAAGAATQITKSYPSTISRIGTVIKGTVVGAFTGAMSGCALGGVYGALPAAVTGGTSILAGCLSVGAFGAIAGGFAGAQNAWVNVDEQGSVQVQVNADPAAPAQLRGPAVLAGEIGAIQNDGLLYSFSCQSGNQPGVNLGTCEPQTATWAALRQQYGVNRTFSCWISSGLGAAAFRACSFVPTMGNTEVWTLPGDPAGYNTFGTPQGNYILYPNNGAPRRVGPSTSPFCGGQVCWVGAKNGPLQNVAGTASTITMFISMKTYQSSAEIPHQHVSSLPEVPSWAKFLGDRIDKSVAENKLSNEYLAAMLNHMWKESGDPNYSPNDPITPADVAETKAAIGDQNIPRIIDMVKPYDTPDQPVQGASQTTPAKSPTQVVVTNPNTGTGGTTPFPEVVKTKEEADTELDDSPGLLGDIMAPAREFFAGPFANFMTPGIALPAVECPVISIDLPTLMGHEEISNAQDSAFVCDWMEEQRPLFLSVLYLFYSLGAVLIVFRNS